MSQPLHAINNRHQVTAPSNNADLLKMGLLVLAVYKISDAFGKDDPDDQPGGDAPPAEQTDMRPATINAVQAATIADAIQVDVFGSGMIQTPWENDDDFAIQLMKAQNTNDVRVIMNAYGRRGSALVDYNLPQTVAIFLDDDRKQAVNADYFTKGIEIAW